MTNTTSLTELIHSLAFLANDSDACIRHTPMIPLHKDTVGEIVVQLRRLQKVEGAIDALGLKEPS